MPCVWSSLSGLPPALHYIINIHLLISVLLVIFFFFYFIAFKLPFPSLFMISWPIFLANKKIRRKVKEQLVNVWIWIKKTKSHNQHSDIALDDLSLEFFLEISSAICNTLCHTFFFFFWFHFFSLFDWELLRGFIFTSLWSLILWDHSIRKMSTPAHKSP